MTIVCPNCHHTEPEGAFFCSECGTKLIFNDGLSTAAIRSTDSSITRAGAAPPPPAPIKISDALVSLHIVRTGQILPLLGREEFTIGRISQGQSILPDVDLTPYEAYSQGVSRLHASIIISEDDISIKDLGSSNGTRVNNNKIPPHRYHTISHGDLITLGRFKIQTLIHQGSN